MKTYRIMVQTTNGTTRVECKTGAKTRKGIMRVLGKAIVRQLKTDVFECQGRLMWREGVARNYNIAEWRTSHISSAEERMVWEVAHDELMGMVA